MVGKSSFYASQLRMELALRNRQYARGRLHVESYGSQPVIVYAPEGARHGNFYDAAYAAILARPEWMHRFDKVHAQAARSLPKPATEPLRRWRELDSCMSSDALLMNVFCTPGVIESPSLRNALGIEPGIGSGGEPVFGWKARVPLKSGLLDRTEVDMRVGTLLVEAKLTESDFQTRAAALVEAYRDFDEVFDRDLLPRVELQVGRRKEAVEFPEDYSQEHESFIDLIGLESGLEPVVEPGGVVALPNAHMPLSDATEPAYESYQLIRNVLAAHAQDCSFCVIHDHRRPDLREAWFQVMAAVKSAALRTRLKVLTWQELVALLAAGLGEKMEGGDLEEDRPRDLQSFLDLKYGIVAPGQSPSPIPGTED